MEVGFLLPTFNFDIISNLQKNFKNTTRNFLGVYLAFSCYLSLFFFCLSATLHGLWVLSSPTRDRTHALSSEGNGVLTTGPPGSSCCISSNLDCYSAFVCFLDCEVFHFFCRLSFSLGLFSVSSWLDSGCVFLGDTTEVMAVSSLPSTRRNCLSLGSQPRGYRRHSSPSGHT